MTKRWISLISLFLIFFPIWSLAQQYKDDSGKLKVLVVVDPYTDTRTGPEMVKGPEVLNNSGLEDLLHELHCNIVKSARVHMPEESEREYGEWNRASLTNRVLGKIIYSFDKDDIFIIGLLSSSKSLVGMLAGLQHLGPGRGPVKDSRGREIMGLVRLNKSKPLKVGLVWIDARAAFNTPDITLKGDMAGMNVAVAAGICSERLRIQAGLDPPLSTKYIVMAGVRATDPHEEWHIDNTFIQTISVNELKQLSTKINTLMARLSRLTDVIYVHVDMSVLDPVELPGQSIAVSGGVSSKKLAACLKTMFTYSKTAAIGIASFPEEPGQITLKAAYRLIEGAIKGVKSRKGETK
jgi:arginase family enzyme